MRLRNKKTGKVEEVGVVDVFGDVCHSYISLARLNEEWEDYEESGVFYAIENSHGQIVKHNDDGYCEHYKEIGNYFETEEEAEKAVEKLKALKRLRDLGFRFDAWNSPNRIYYTMEGWGMDARQDLDLLFGGKE